MKDAVYILKRQTFLHFEVAMTENVLNICGLNIGNEHWKCNRSGALAKQYTEIFKFAKYSAFGSLGTNLNQRGSETQERRKS